MKQGIIIESNAEYHGYQYAISKSRLANMSVCPKYFKWCEENPKTSEDLTFGSAFHKVVLEPNDFDKEFAIMPNINRRTNAGKEEYAQFCLQNEGKGIITIEDFEIIKEMKSVITESKYASALLKGEHEQSFYFNDEVTGVLCKVRPDCWRKIGDRVVITDVKTCKSSLPKDFTNDIVKYGYDLQAYLYRYGVSKVLNIPIESVDFVFIAVGKSAPYLMNICQPDEYIYQRGEMLFRQYIGMYAQCLKTGNWWGLNGEQGIINNVSLPAYMLKEIETNNKGE